MQIQLRHIVGRIIFHRRDKSSSNIIIAKLPKPRNINPALRNKRKGQYPRGVTQTPAGTKKMLQPECRSFATTPQRWKCNGDKLPVGYTKKGNSYEHKRKAQILQCHHIKWQPHQDKPVQRTYGLIHKEREREQRPNTHQKVRSYKNMPRISSGRNVRMPPNYKEDILHINRWNKTNITNK